MTSSNTGASATTSTILAALRENKPVASAQLSITDFRDIYNRVAGTELGEELIWAIILLGDQAVIQPFGRSNVSLFLASTGGHHYTKDDFSFIHSNRARFYGSVNGRYRFRSFLTDIFGWRRLGVITLSTVALAVAAYLWIPREVVEKLHDAMISALAIFISIFVLFVLNVDPEKEFGYILSDRYRKLTQSDRFIAQLGIAALAIAIIGAGLSAAPTPPRDSIIQVVPWFAIPSVVLLRAAQSTGLAISLALTATSFWLVIEYHFSRRHEMTEIRMAKSLLERLQTTRSSPTA